MKKRHSRIGLIGSLTLHGTLFATVFGIIHTQKPLPTTEEVSSISMEMLAARLEQEQVAVAAEEPVEEEVKKPEPVIEPEPIPEPVPEPPKPKEKPKEKPKPKEKSKPKEKPPVKAIEKGAEAKQGVVAKAIPSAVQGAKNQEGIVTGSPKGSGTVNSGSASGGEINAYKAQLQRTLQQRANNAYPQREKMMRKTGTVTLSFQLSSSGQVINVQVINSSGNSNLDAAAMKAAQSTKMHSPPPAGFPTSLTVPVKFSVQ
ncbi:cell envelope integrity protein TolA [Glaesserella parasuis]|nr:cell envelope integrity protein TolA [Glaesserella parasuis]